MKESGAADKPERKPGKALEAGAGSPCPACGFERPKWSYFCFGCFLKLPVKLQFSLAAMTADRRGAADAALRILRQVEADRRAAESGFLKFPGGANGS